MNLSFYFTMFIIYSMLGWIAEIIYCFIITKKFINRGFLIGPYCPIYGVGALLVSLLLNDYLDSPLVVFTLSIVISAIVEYLGSYLLEKIFNTSWWDYSQKKYNINGRICLEALILFGIGCLIIMYVTNPFISKWILYIPRNILNIIAIILFIIFFIDILISIKITWKFKKISQNAKEDSTEKVTEFIKKEILEKKNILYKRLINAFPKLKVTKIKKN